MPSVLLATCTELPDGDEDAAVLVAALAARGVSARWAAWTDPDVDWSAGLVVLRSTWDYTADRDAFVRWVTALPRVANDPAVIRWNTDKVYLHDLAEDGVPTVATAVVPPCAEVAFPAADEFVIKPSVGAGSRGVGRFRADRTDAAMRHIALLHAAGRTALVQPYLDAVDAAGETALIYIDGVFSHAVRKGPMLAPRQATPHPLGAAAGAAKADTVSHHPVQGAELYVEEEISRREPDAAELEVGARAIAALRDRFGADQLYTRVDLLPSPDGPVVIELELTEPSLFLQYGPEGTDPTATFAAAIARRAAP
jgi:glutathione synthase/RimK-type ligase-like ATP-grasp enzyme